MCFQREREREIERERGGWHRGKTTGRNLFGNIGDWRQWSRGPHDECRWWIYIEWMAQLFQNHSQLAGGRRCAPGGLWSGSAFTASRQLIFEWKSRDMQRHQSNLITTHRWISRRWEQMMTAHRGLMLGQLKRFQDVHCGSFAVFWSFEDFFGTQAQGSRHLQELWSLAAALTETMPLRICQR